MLNTKYAKLRVIIEMFYLNLLDLKIFLGILNVLWVFLIKQIKSTQFYQIISLFFQLDLCMQEHLQIQNTWMFQILWNLGIDSSVVITDWVSSTSTQEESSLLEKTLAFFDGDVLKESELIFTSELSFRQVKWSIIKGDKRIRVWIVDHEEKLASVKCHGKILSY